MAFQWLQMRIQEEAERRELQRKHLERMPAALQEIHDYLADCIRSYTENYGSKSADIAWSMRIIRWQWSSAFCRAIRSSTGIASRINI